MLSPVNARPAQRVSPPSLFAKRWEEIGSDVVGGTPEEFDALVLSEAERLSGIIRNLGIQLD